MTKPLLTPKLIKKPAAPAPPPVTTTPARKPVPQPSTLPPPTATTSLVPESPLKTSLTKAECTAIKHACLPVWEQGQAVTKAHFHELRIQYNVDKEALKQILKDLQAQVSFHRTTCFQIEQAYFLAAPTWEGDQSSLCLKIAKELKTTALGVQSWILRIGYVPRYVREACAAAGFEATPESLQAVGDAYLQLLQGDGPPLQSLHQTLADRVGGITKQQVHFLLFTWRGRFTESRFPPVKKKKKGHFKARAPKTGEDK